MNKLNKLPGLEACELSGAVADAVIDAAKFGNLEELSLVEIEQDAFRVKLVRAGMAVSDVSERSAMRAEKTL